MIRPTKHPKTGVYRVRLAIPAHLRPTAKELFRRSAEFIENLGTKDCAEAKVRAVEASARLSARLAAVRAAHGAQDAKLSERQVRALAGIWYAGEAAKWADNPGSAEQWEEREFILLDQLETQGDPADRETWTQVVVVSEEDRADAVELLASQGMPPTQEAIGRVAMAIWEAKWALSKTMLRRARGDWSEDAHLLKFPTLPQGDAVPASGRPVVTDVGDCTLDALLEGWALDRGWRLDVRPQPRALYDRVRTAERLAVFIGHRSADAVSKDDAVRWKEEMQRRNLHAATIRNDISEMSAIWKWGIANGKLRSDANPFLGILPPKQKRRKAVRAFTDQEAASILIAARKAEGSLRWLPWLLCLTGTRLNEVCQATRDDIKVIDGVVTIRIHDDDPGRTLKNAESRRTIPLHPALIEEGFPTYVEGLPAGSTLWPDMAPDKLFGLRSTTVGKRIARWLRDTVGISDGQICEFALNNDPLRGGFRFQS